MRRKRSKLRSRRVPADKVVPVLVVAAGAREAVNGVVPLAVQAVVNVAGQQVEPPQPREEPVY